MTRLGAYKNITFFLIPAFYVYLFIFFKIVIQICDKHLKTTKTEMFLSFF